MKKGKRGQASLIVVILLLILIMVLVVIAVVILLVNPNILGLGQVQPTQSQIIIRTIQETPSQPSQPVCIYPYTLVGYTCCLDKNFNGICDSDEIQRQNIQYCSRPYIRDGTACCIDENDNNICDIYEYHSHSYSHNTIDSSYLDSPFDLSSLNIRTSEISIRISNIGDYDYIIKSIDIDGCDTIHPDKIIYEGDNQDFTIPCSSSNSDRDVTIEYKRSGSDTTRTSSGRIRKD